MRSTLTTGPNFCDHLSLKQEAIYLEEIRDDFRARHIIKDWMAFYNTQRHHSALERQTPDDEY